MSESKIPNCIGIIIDGNRRWARGRGLPTLAGHKAGYEKVREVVSWSRAAGVKCVIVYAFSTENWNRAPEEVSYLMELLQTALLNEVENFNKDGVRLRFIGQRERLEPGIQDKMRQAEERTKNNSAITLVLALSYGGRPEIVAAMNRILESQPSGPVSEEEFSRSLWTADLPDPDLIVRTGGEQRLSNFLTWQSVYSELFFIKTYWPDFSEAEFKQILDEYAARERRFGK